MSSKSTFGNRHAVLSQQLYLVSCSNVLLTSVHVDPLGNVRTLLLQSHQHVTRLIVKTCKGGGSERQKDDISNLTKESIVTVFSILLSHLFQSCRSQCVWWCPSPPSGSRRWRAMWSLHTAAPCQSYIPFLPLIKVSSLVISTSNLNTFEMYCIFFKCMSIPKPLDSQYFETLITGQSELR